MTKSTRRRGRPTGTGIDDSADLFRMAELLADHPSMKPTAAIKSISTKWTESSVRRLQRKWKAVGFPILQHAKAARAPKPNNDSRWRIASPAKPRPSAFEALQLTTSALASAKRVQGMFPALSFGRQIVEQQKGIEVVMPNFTRAIQKAAAAQEDMVLRIIGART